MKTPKRRRSTAAELSRMFKIPKGRAVEAIFKADLISAILKELARYPITHAEIAARSGLPRSAVTGILSGSLQKVTIDRVLRILDAVGLEATIKVRRAA